MSSSITQFSADNSIDNDFGAHSVSQILKNRRAKVLTKKSQPWKETYVVSPTDVPSSSSLHDKPWYRSEDLDSAYEDHSGAWSSCDITRIDGSWIRW